MNGDNLISKKLNNQKLILIRAMVNCILITFCIISAVGCVTTERLEVVSPDSLKSGYLTEIPKILLKNGNTIDCRNKLIHIQKESDSAEFIVIENAGITDTVKEGSKGYIYNTKMSVMKIPLSDVQKIYQEKSEVNAPMSVLIIFGSIIVFIVVLIALSGGPLGD